MIGSKVVAVIVTYNRLELLKICVDKVLKQTYPLAEIIVVNNDSTDGTKDWLSGITGITTINQENLGGAGGFYTGFDYAVSSGADWIWCMDDDCEPAVDALQEIINLNPQKNQVYGSIAVSNSNPDEIVWWLANEEVKGQYIKKLSQLKGNTYQTTHTIPFLGLFVSTDVVKAIGLPQKELVLWNDDEEYSYRAMAAGFKLCYATKSIISHPPVVFVPVTILFSQTYFIKSNPFKSRYFYRNSTYVAKKYNSSAKFYTMILPKKIIKAFGHAYLDAAPGQRIKTFSIYVKEIINGIKGKLGTISQ